MCVLPLVGMVHAFGPVVHVQQSVSHESRKVWQSVVKRV